MGCRGSSGRAGLLATTAVAVFWACGPASAQPDSRAAPVTLAQAEARFFEIPAQPLAGALTAFGQQSGLQVTVDTAVLAGLNGQAVSGSLAPEEALRRLLAGTGMSWRFTDARTVALEKAPARSGAVTLDPVQVEGRGSRAEETFWSPVEGYVATRTATATKTDTPLIETPQSVSVITRDQMLARGVESTAQALRYTPGVNGEAFGVDTREGGLQIRGFAATDTGFYRDGLRLRGTAFATVQLDPYAAERIEVLRGPASVLYGQSEPGGVVNSVSKRPTVDGLNEVELGIGSFDRHEGKFDLGGAVSADRTLAFRLTGLVRESDTQVDFVEHDRIFIAPALAWRPNAETSLTILTQYQRDDTGWAIQFLPAAGTVLPNPNGRIPVGRFVGEPTYDYYKLSQVALGYLFEHKASETWTFRQNARYVHLDNDQKGVFGNGLDADGRTLSRYADEGNSDLATFTVDNQAQARFATGPITHTLLLGLDAQRSKYSDRGTYADVSQIDIFNPVYGAPIPELPVYTDTDIRQTQVGVYLQDQLKLGERWILLLGGRHDWARTSSVDQAIATSSRQKDTAFTGRVGLTYVSEIGVAPYASYTEAFLPVLGTSATGQLYEPETAQQYEVGVKVQPPGWNSFLTAALFDLTRQNQLTRDPIDPTAQIQTGEVRSRGLELEAVASLPFGLDLIAAYTYLDTEITRNNDGNQGNTPYGVPRHKIAVWADYKIRAGALAGLGLGGGVRYTGKTFGDDANTFRVPGYTLFDAAIHYDWDSFRFALNASNVFDNDHVASCFGAAAGCFYGAGRTVLATARYRW